jgi:hypothetical protein
LGVITLPGGVMYPPTTIDTRISQNILLKNLGVIETSPISLDGGWLNFGMNEHFNSGQQKYGAGTYHVDILFVN